MLSPAMNIAIGSDHGGFDLKQGLKPFLRDADHQVTDCGCHDKNAADYPRIAFSVAQRVASGDADYGIVIDGAGIGSAMAANKTKGVLAAACYNEALANNCREHNGANVLTLGSGQTSLEEAKAIVSVFLSTKCTASRHLRRVQLIKDIEQGQLKVQNLPSAQYNSTKENDVELTPQDIEKIALRVSQLIQNPSAAPAADASAGGPLGPEAMAQMIDHTLLKPEASKGDVERLCKEAMEYNFFSVCVNSINVPQAAALVKGSGVKVCSVVGFPLGAQPPDIKALETRKAIREGAQEIDMVINIGALKSGDYDLVLKDIRAVCEECMERHVLSKVILETAILTDDEKVKACELSMQAKANYVKTSTGFGSGGAKAEDIRLMAQTTASKKLGVKASGGVRTYDDAMKMINAGATRIGASSSIKIIEEASARAS